MHNEKHISDSESKEEHSSGLDDASCCASFVPMIVGVVEFFDDGSYRACGKIDQTICSLPTYHEQSTNSSLDDAACCASDFDSWLDRELEISRKTNEILRESIRDYRESGVYKSIDWGELENLGVSVVNPYPSHQSNEESLEIPSDTLRSC
jgi:hypothetical protein